MKIFPQWIPTSCYFVDYEANRKVLVKDESTCPNYTFKDRLALEFAKRLFSASAGPDMLVSSITMGNTAFSLAWGIKLIYGDIPHPNILAIVPKDFHERKLGPDSKGRFCYGTDVINTMRNIGIYCYEYDLNRRRLNATEIAEFGKSIGLKFRTHIDVSEGIPEPCYGPIVKEALAQAEKLSFKIEIILVPVGAGILFEATVATVKKAKSRATVLGISVLDEISIADKIWAYFSPYYKDLTEHGQASSLTSKYHKVYCVTDNEIRRALNNINGNIEAEPSAAAAFSLLERKNVISTKAKVLVINTGNGFLWAKKDMVG